MNRLTKRSPYTGIAGAIDEAARLSITDRLAAYEDTGLEPEEIPRVVATLQTVQKNKSELFETLSRYLNAEAEGRLLVLPCKVGDTIYEIDLPEYGIIVSKVIWIDYYVGPAAHVQGNEMVAAESVSVEVIDGHGKGSCYTFEKGDFGKTVFLTREEAEAALKEDKQRLLAACEETKEDKHEQ